MKCIKLYTLLIISAMLMLSVNLSAQISCENKIFSFPDGPSEWSAVLTTHLQSKDMDKKNIEAVPLEIKIKAAKKKMLACHYEVEIRNTSTTQGISFAAYNSYTDASNRYIYHKLKLKPGQTGVFKILFADLRCKIKSVDDCTECGWNLFFKDIKPL